MDEGRTGPASRTVGLFLVDGAAHGIVIAEIGNWNGKVLAAPRGRLAELLRRPEASRTGVYVLTGPDPDRPDGVLCYIGEADDIARRMANHLRSDAKDFADRFALVVSSDDMLTKAHVRYLEGGLIRLVTKAGAVVLTNETAPDFQRLPEGDKADMETFLEQLRITLPLVGFDIFRSAKPERPGGSPVFTFATSGASARARDTEDGFLVLSGSTARKAESGTFPQGYRALRQRLLDASQLQRHSAELYGFAKDTLFSSSSAAASIIAGRSASGPLEWKLETTGGSYRDWRAAQLATLAVTVSG